jgi:HEPN domain-containing protein
MNTLTDELALCKAAYHVQQAVEKTLKGILELSGIDITFKQYRTHDIDLLISFVPKDKEVPEVIQERAFKITKWAVEARYNINYRVSFKELQLVYEACNRWVEDILKNINT